MMYSYCGYVLSLFSDVENEAKRLSGTMYCNSFTNYLALLQTSQIQVMVPNKPALSAD